MSSWRSSAPPAKATSSPTPRTTGARRASQQELAPAIARARELGLQLYCGEFGCLPTVPRADRLAYYRDFIGTLEQNGIAWANWEYKGDFGLFEWHREKTLTGAPDVELIDALLSHAKAK